MHRRKFIAASAAALATIPGLSQNLNPNRKGPPDAPEPFIQIVPPVPLEAYKVHAIVAFTCPVCAHYHGILSGWGASIPAKFSFDFLPSVTDRDSTTTAMAWLAMKKAAPEKLNALATVLFTGIQERGLSPSAPDGALWKIVMRELGPTPGFSAALKSIRPEEIAFLTKKISAFQVKATPSLVVSGRYVITPDHANGDEALFIQLANGMVSKSM